MDHLGRAPFRLCCCAGDIFAAIEVFKWSSSQVVHFASVVVRPISLQQSRSSNGALPKWSISPLLLCGRYLCSNRGLQMELFPSGPFRLCCCAADIFAAIEIFKWSSSQVVHIASVAAR